MKKYTSEEKVNEEILKKLQGQDKKEFKQGLRSLDLPDPELKAAFKRLCPDASEREIDIMVNPDAYKK